MDAGKADSAARIGTWGRRHAAAADGGLVCADCRGAGDFVGGRRVERGSARLGRGASDGGAGAGGAHASAGAGVVSGRGGSGVHGLVDRGDGRGLRGVGAGGGADGRAAGDACAGDRMRFAAAVARERLGVLAGELAVQAGCEGDARDVVGGGDGAERERVGDNAAAGGGFVRQGFGVREQGDRATGNREGLFCWRGWFGRSWGCGGRCGFGGGEAPLDSFVGGGRNAGQCYGSWRKLALRGLTFDGGAQIDDLLLEGAGRSAHAVVKREAGVREAEQGLLEFGGLVVGRGDARCLRDAQQYVVERIEMARKGQQLADGAGSGVGARSSGGILVRRSVRMESMLALASSRTVPFFHLSMRRDSRVWRTVSSAG